MSGEGIAVVRPAGGGGRIEVEHVVDGFVNVLVVDSTDGECAILDMSPGEARELAAALTRFADRVETAADCSGPSGERP